MNSTDCGNAPLNKCDDPTTRTVYVNLLDTESHTANFYDTEAEARAVKYLNVKPLAVAVPVEIVA